MKVQAGVVDEATRDTRVWTVPNALSMLRLLGLPLFLWLVLGPEADGWALGVLAASGITDYLDGYLARRLDQASRLGQILDPVADRLYILAVVIGLALRDIEAWDGQHAVALSIGPGKSSGIFSTGDGGGGGDPGP